jgi:hypothetical protein
VGVTSDRLLIRVLLVAHKPLGFLLSASKISSLISIFIENLIDIIIGLNEVVRNTQ